MTKPEQQDHQGQDRNIRTVIDAMVGKSLADVERDLILATLVRCGGNRTWAADMLGLAPLELRDRLVGYGREAEARARAVARREADLEADMRAGKGPRPTYIPSPALLA